MEGYIAGDSSNVGGVSQGNSKIQRNLEARGSPPPPPDIEMASNDARIWDGQADGETSGKPPVDLSSFPGR